MKCLSCGEELSVLFDKKDHPMYNKTLYLCDNVNCQVRAVTVEFIGGKKL